jgi:hypothetical protein
MQFYMRVVFANNRAVLSDMCEISPSPSLSIQTSILYRLR